MKTTNIGKTIANLRKEKGKTAEQLAEALGVSRQTISKWENGETVPNAYNMLDISTYLDVAIVDVYDQILESRIVRDEEDINGKIKNGSADFAELIAELASCGYDEMKNVKEAIVAYDKGFSLFDMKIGYNVVRYEDVLRRLNNGYVFGIKENDYPVEAQRLKDSFFVMPAFATFLKENGLLAYYGYPSDEIYDMFVYLENEHDVLRFKELVKIFFVGLAEFKNHKWLRLLFASPKEESKKMHEKKYELETISHYKGDDEEELRYDEIETIAYMDTKEELEKVLKIIARMNKSDIEEMLESNDGDKNVIGVNGLDGDNQDGFSIANVDKMIEYFKER